MKKKNKIVVLSKSVKNVALEILVISALILPLVVFGQVTGAPETGAGLLSLINTIFGWFAAVLFVVAAIFIIIAAFGYLTAGGDEEKVKSAKQKLVYAVIALIVGALAFFIPKIILDVLNIKVETVSPERGF